MLASNVQFSISHKEAIDLFGRYPSRNKVLGRTSTPEEAEYLEKKGGWGQ